MKILITQQMIGEESLKFVTKQLNGQREQKNNAVICLTKPKTSVIQILKI